MRKNYIKLIGSIICAFSMVMTVALVTIGAQANDKTITYVANVKYEQDNTVPTAPEGYSVEDGYLFAGWYTEGGENANADGYSAVTTPEEGKTYHAKYVPSEVLGVKAQVSGQIIDNDTEEIQNNKDDNAIRFVTSLDSTEYNHIGFNIKIAGTNYDQDAMTTKSVYKTIYGIGADKNTEMTEYKPYNEFHGESVYFKTYTFTAIPENAFDSDITVTPYWITLDGTRVEGTTGIKTVNLGRSWIYVNSDSTSEVELGTLNAPYKTMANAVAHDTTLPLKVTLKSDVTISETINIGEGKNITITDDGTERTLSKRGDTNFDMISLETDATLTLQSTGAVDDYKLLLDGSNLPEGADGSTIVRMTSGVAATVNINPGVKLQNNNSDNGGAAVCVETNAGSVNIDGAHFENISAGKNGGAIYLNGECIIENSMFKNCSSTAVGGAIFVNYDEAKNINATCDITDTEFDDCSSGTDGGAIYNKGNLMLTGESSKAIFSGNETGSGNGGGAIYTLGTLKVTGYKFKSNSAKNGGAVYIKSGAISTEITDCVFDTNTATNAGSALYINDDCTLSTTSEITVFTGHSTDGNKRAIFLKAATLTVSGFTLTETDHKESGTTDIIYK